MGRRLLLYLIMPAILCAVSFCALGVLTLLIEEINTSSWVVNALDGLLNFYVVGFLVLIIIWWGIPFSRWLYEKYNWETLSYAIANLILGFSIVGASLAIAVGINSFMGTLSVLIVFLGLLGGGFWYVRSAYKIIVRREHVYYSIHWLLLKKGSFLLNIRDYFFTAKSAETPPIPLQTQAPLKRPKRKPHKSSIFRQVTTSSQKPDDRGAVPIPPRKSKSSQRAPAGNISRTTEPYRPSPSIRISFSSPRTSFVKEARKYVNRSEKNATHVPFMQYWPTYSSMSKEQLKWYFYWRTQLRKGDWLPSDTSYLFVHIYEVINVIGFASPKAAFDHLVKLWEYYRKLQPKLDNYLPDWLADFIIVHKLAIKPLDWYSRVAQLGVRGDEDLQIEAWLQTNNNLALLSNDLIYRLSGYNPTKNKYYKQHNQELNLDTAYKTGVQAVNTYLGENSGQSLFRHYQSRRTRRVTRTPFASALHSYPENKIEIALVHTWVGNEKLATVLKNIIKHTENVIREQNGYRHKLRGIELPSEWKKVIEAAFVTAPPKREVEIDLSQIEQLEEESRAIRERLIIDDIEVDEPGTSHPPSDDQERTQAQVTAGYLLRPDGTPDHLLTDLQEIASVLGSVETDAAKVARVFMQNNWCASLENIQSRLNGQFANVIIDQINEKSLDEIGDALIFEEDGLWTVTEDYRDEIEYILEHPDYQSAGPEAVLNTASEKYPDLEVQWQEFVTQMQQYHWDALAALLSSVDVQTRLDAIARPLHKTGNLLVDEINEYAQESIGDIIVDTIEDPPRILEDEQDNLTHLLNWAADRQLVEV